MADFLQQAFFFLLLTGDAVARPGNSFKAFGVDLIATAHTLSKRALADPLQSLLDHVEKLPVVVTDRKEELLRVRIGCAIGNILRCLLHCGESFAGASWWNHTQQLWQPFAFNTPRNGGAVVGIRGICAQDIAIADFFGSGTDGFIKVENGDINPGRVAGIFEMRLWKGSNWPVD